MERHLVFSTPNAFSTTHFVLDSLKLYLASIAFWTGSWNGVKNWGEKKEKSWGTRQLLESSTSFLQLIPVGEADDPPKHPLGVLADLEPYHDMWCNECQKPLTQPCRICATGQPVNKHKDLKCLSPSTVVFPQEIN
ncbi:uncharacterized protein AKAME5_002487600 [Lates japonicus]|uniref:Uncharacterized protein n=1 Tax=Lates japonicus TaxID=270547 RepID=A0AAD3NM32_LATJO|nr:uncharacterized protein AKAME5_002487600 [Lates japonicus]